MSYELMFRNLGSLNRKQLDDLARHDAGNGQRILELYHPCEVPTVFVEAATSANPSFGAALADARDEKCVYGVAPFCDGICKYAIQQIFNEKMKAREQKIKDQLRMP